MDDTEREAIYAGQKEVNKKRSRIHRERVKAVKEEFEYLELLLIQAFDDDIELEFTESAGITLRDMKSGHMLGFAQGFMRQRKAKDFNYLSECTRVMRRIK